eukprot:14926803-Alexandrium_andersonii.AAC.1
MMHCCPTLFGIHEAPDCRIAEPSHWQQNAVLLAMATAKRVQRAARLRDRAPRPLRTRMSRSGA